VLADVASLAARLSPPWDFIPPWEAAAVMAQHWTRAALSRTTVSCRLCWAGPVLKCCWHCSYCTVPTSRTVSLLAGASGHDGSTKKHRGCVTLAWDI